MTHPLTLTRGFIHQVINQGRLDLAADYLAPDSVHHELEDSAPDFQRGPEGVAEVIDLYRCAIPDLHWSIEDEICDGERVVTRFRMRGTHENPLMGLAPSGRPIDVSGVRIDRCAGGKIAESWIVWDSLGRLRQVGALPELERDPVPAAPAATWLFQPRQVERMPEADLELLFSAGVGGTRRAGGADTGTRPPLFHAPER